MREGKKDAIIIALCRCVLGGNPNEATRHQINRLHEWCATNDSDMAVKLDSLINPKPTEMDNLKIVKSN